MTRRGFLAAPLLQASGGRPRRTNRVVSQLRQIEPKRRLSLKLGDRIPEIDDIELNNDASPAPVPRKILRLIAWNSERGRYWQEGVRLIQSNAELRDPDVVFLGEMDLGMARSGNVHTTREMAAAMHLNYAYGVEFLEFTGGEPQERKQYPGQNEWGYHGNAILSRYPLEKLQMLRFPGIEKWWNDYQKRLGGRMALFAKIRLDREVALISTHLESSEQDARTRHVQVRMLLEELRRYAPAGPVLLGGDLNAPPTEPAFAELKSAGFLMEEGNELGVGTLQRIEDGKFTLVKSHHIDYLCVRGVRIVRDAMSPKVIPAVERDKLLADHAIVALKVEV